MLTFYAPVRLDPPATGKPDPVVDLGDPSQRHHRPLALAGAAGPQERRRSTRYAGRSPARRLSIGVYPAARSPGQVLPPQRTGSARRRPGPGGRDRRPRARPGRTVRAPGFGVGPPRYTRLPLTLRRAGAGRARDHPGHPAAVRAAAAVGLRPGGGGHRRLPAAARRRRGHQPAGDLAAAALPAARHDERSGPTSRAAAAPAPLATLRATTTGDRDPAAGPGDSRLRLPGCEACGLRGCGDDRTSAAADDVAADRHRATGRITWVGRQRRPGSSRPSRSPGAARAGHRHPVPDLHPGQHPGRRRRPSIAVRASRCSDVDGTWDAVDRDRRHLRRRPRADRSSPSTAPTGRITFGSGLTGLRVRRAARRIRASYCVRRRAGRAGPDRRHQPVRRPARRLHGDQPAADLGRGRRRVGRRRRGRDHPLAAAPRPAGHRRRLPRPHPADARRRPRPGRGAAAVPPRAGAGTRRTGRGWSPCWSSRAPTRCARSAPQPDRQFLDAVCGWLEPRAAGHHRAARARPGLPAGLGVRRHRHAARPGAVAGPAGGHRGRGDVPLAADRRAAADPPRTAWSSPAAGTGWPLGVSTSAPQDIEAVATRVPGVRYVDSVMLAAIDAGGARGLAGRPRCRSAACSCPPRPCSSQRPGRRPGRPDRRQPADVRRPPLPVPVVPPTC